MKKLYHNAQYPALLRSQEGVTAVEFAIVAPVLLLLIFGVLEFAMIMLASNMLESATAISSRLGKTGYAALGVTREQTILDAIEQRAGALIDTDDITITAKAYQQFDQINDPEPYNDTNGNGAYDSSETFTDINGNGEWDADMGVAGYGGPGDIVVYSINYGWRLMTPIVSGLIGEAGYFPITTRAVVKNEPY